MEKNPEVQMAWDIIEKTGANLFLTGKAGTGKTTFLKELKEKSPKRMVVLAPTGIAAINAGGVTIHSFFQLPLSPYVPGATFGKPENKYFRFSNLKRNIIRTMDLLVIDEISMVRADLLDAVDSVMRRYREHNKPFGGAQLLLIGDLQQLAPVIKEDEWTMLSRYYATPYFFSSKALNAAKYLTVELNTVYRQQDSRFIALLNQIRENKATDATLAELNSRCIPNFRPATDSDYIRLTTHNYPAQIINERELQQLPGTNFAFKAEVEGTFPESSYPTDETLVLKQGAQIMFIKNDTEKRYFNGMIGEIVYVDDKRISVRGKNGGMTFDLDKAEWTNSKYTLDNASKEIKETIEGVFRQYPVRLAWAITIHKSQGLTFEHAIIDASHSFAHGQTYVALSRCKSLEGMVLSEPLTRQAIISDSTVDTFTNKMGDSIPTRDQISALQHAFTIQILDELFDFTPLHSAFNMLLRTIDEHLYNRYPKLLAEFKKTSLVFNPLLDVSQKFKNQYVRMLTLNPDITDVKFQERIHKAADYFYETLNPIFMLYNKIQVSIENKVVRKQFDDRFAVFSEELLFKRNILNYEGGHAETGGGTTFTTADYLRAKAKILLGLDPNVKEKPETKRKRTTTKTPRAVKEQKIPTKEISFNMFMEGKSVKEIATARGLVTSTIFNHLLSYVHDGHIEPEKLHPMNHRDMIMSFISRHPDIKNTSEIKSELGPDVSYEEIHLVRELMNRENL